MSQIPPVPPQRKSIQVEVPQGLKATYSNLVVLSHSAMEIFLDFAQLLPGMPKALVHTRIMMSPIHAKLLHRALGENLERYEATFGPIDVPPSLAEQLFGGVKPSSAPPEEDSNG
jgi:hypothetical protein